MTEEPGSQGSHMNPDGTVNQPDGSPNAGAEPGQGSQPGGRQNSGKPRVAKTILENPVAGADHAEESINEEPPAAPRKMAKTVQEGGTAENRKPRRIAKTLIESRLTGVDLQTIIDASTAQSAGQEPEVRRDFVAKTMLDHSVLKDMSNKFAAKKEAKAIEEAKERALEPQIPFEPIVTDKLASNCPWRWDDPDPVQRFKICTKCQANIYNFEGLELPEAEAIIFRRENRKHAALFKREDGKFMTTPCPVETRRKRDRSTMIMVGTVLIIAAIVLIMLMPPPPKRVEAPPAPELSSDEATPELRPVKNKDGSYRYEAKPSEGGSYHYEGGKVTQTQPAQSQPVQAAPAPTADPDSDGNFWKYSNPNDAQSPTTIVDPMAPPQSQQPSQQKAPPNSVPIPQNPNVRNY